MDLGSKFTQGLYNPEYEHDACGVGMIANIRGAKSHQLVLDALTVLGNMAHRGAEGADNKSGDGAGILLQIPHEFILLNGIPVPEKGTYACGMVFLPKNDEPRQAAIMAELRRLSEEYGLKWLAERDVPVRSEVLGRDAAQGEPAIKQVFLSQTGKLSDRFETDLYLLRKQWEKEIQDEDFYVVSLSSQVVVYKGMLTSQQLKDYFVDLTTPYLTSGLALVHSRFSTNTFPRWSLAQPFRMLAHNGEINTVRGNRDRMRSLEPILESEALGDASHYSPIIQAGMSDSASLDNALEFLVRSGMSLQKAMSVLVPESFNEKNPISAELKAFYEYHSILMEPWDGPADLLFSDGRFAGGMLDRNGLRPARYTITNDGMIVVASEVGVLDIDSSRIRSRGRLRPGKLLMVDTEQGKIYLDDELKSQLAHEFPYAEWLSSNHVDLDKLHTGKKVSNAVEDYERKLACFGYTREDVDRIIVPMTQNAQEPVGSMGNDTPLAVLSDQPQLLFNYFRQQFAQVTNPAIDPIREELVMSLTEYIGMVDTDILTPRKEHCKMVRLKQPVLTNTQLDILSNIGYKGFTSVKLPMLFEAVKGEEGLRQALDELCLQAEQAVNDKINYIILSDRGVSPRMAAIPSLLALSAVHNHLIKVHKRCQIALIVESGEIRCTMHAAMLIGYGASALNPYMSFAVLDKLVSTGALQLDYETAEKHFIKALDKGLLKIMSKMGISTIRSYRGAHIFEPVGLGAELLGNYFGMDRSSVGGLGLKEIAADAVALHRQAFGTEVSDVLPFAGEYQFRKDGTTHAWTPEVITGLQLATRLGSYSKFKQFTSLVDNKPKPIFLRDFFRFKSNPISIDQVEPEEAIVKRFVTGAMSFGAISKEAHEAIALAMNKLGGRSNTGEGGEDSVRFKGEVDGVSLNSTTKQVASGRFGVTCEYLVNATEIQIKVAQGAKPGEGGQLPGFKVNEIIARTRHSIPGISLISPPPHHDIYSIEDLAQLIYDLKNVNPTAKVSVKLVAESGVGTIAAGVAKAKADLVVISGAEGGTGASPISSMRYAGISPEIGLAETHQTLVLNGLRGKVELQVDGQLKTGRDIVAMALLGAGEFAFGTAALVVLGCLLMRKCHTNLCPVGVATQSEELRRHFMGRSEYLVNYFTFLAREVREYLADMGFRSFDEIIGRSDLIEIDTRYQNARTATLDFSRLLAKVKNDKETRYDRQSPAVPVSIVCDKEILQAASGIVEADRGKISLEYSIANTDRACGAYLSGEIARRYGGAGLSQGEIDVCFKGTAGQSFGAFLVKGLQFKLEGEANDYVGKSLSGGRILICPPVKREFPAADNMIAGNTLLYGATSGELYINGQAGERFAVRNSGATAVVEGVGDHCCEYMTGGRVVVLGSTGRNFAAGMSGGIAYVWNKDGNFDYYCNMDMIELSLVSDSVYQQELRSLIENHLKYTGSELAATMLANWSDYLGRFIMVMPIEYKHVLQEQQLKALREKISRVERDY